MRIRPECQRQMRVQVSAFENVHVLQAPADPQHREAKPVNPREQLLLKGISFQINVSAQNRISHLVVA